MRIHALTKMCGKSNKVMILLNLSASEIDLFTSMAVGSVVGHIYYKCATKEHYFRRLLFGINVWRLLSCQIESLLHTDRCRVKSLLNLIFLTKNGENLPNYKIFPQILNGSQWNIFGGQTH